MEQPSFDTWKSLFLFASAQGIFLSLLIASQKTKKWKPNYYLAATVLFFSVMMGYYVSYWTGFSKHLPGYFSLIQGFTYLISVSLLLYVQSHHKAISIKQASWHYLVFIVYIGLRVLKVQPANLIFPIFQCLHLSVYAIWIWTEAQKSKANTFLKVLTWAYALFALSFWVYYILVWTDKLTLEQDYFISLIISAVIYYIGYAGYQQNTALLPKYSSSVLPHSLSNEIINKLQQHFDLEKPYLSGDLKLSNVSNTLGFSTQQISQVINQQIGKSFTDFVNGYRVETAKVKLLTSNDKVEHIAYDSGFNNKVSFYQAFKKSTGLSPTQFRKQQQAQKEV